MFFFARTSIPAPYSYQVAIGAIPFALGLGGFLNFFRLFRKSKKHLTEGATADINPVVKS